MNEVYILWIFLSLQYMEFTAAQISGFINGEIIGNQDAKITGVSPIESGQEGYLSFIAQDRFSEYLHKTDCSVLIVSKKLITDGSYKPTIIAVEDAYLSFQILMNLYEKMQSKKSGIEQPSFIHESCKIGENI